MTLTVPQAAQQFFREFFIENDNTRRAYHQSVRMFVLYLARGPEYYEQSIAACRKQKRREHDNVLYELTRRDLDELWRDVEAENAAILDALLWEGDETFQPPIPADVSIRRDIRTLPLDSLPVAQLGEFVIWLMRAGHVKGKPYSRRTATLRKVGFYKALAYWNFRKLTPVSRAEVEAYVDKSGVQSERALTPRHEHVPPNYVSKMEAAVTHPAHYPLPGRPETPLYSTDDAARAKQQKRWQDDDLAAHKTRLDSLRAQGLVFLLADTGMRISDVVALTFADFETFDPENEYAYRSQKTGALGRVMFRQETIDILARYLNERSDESPFLYIQHGNNGRRPSNDRRALYLARNRGYGAAISESSASRIILEVAEAAGFVEFETRRDSNNQPYQVRKHHEDFVSAHAFRHARAQRMLDQGVPASIVAQVLGHESTKTTEDIYGNRASSQVIRDAYRKTR